MKKSLEDMTREELIERIKQLTAANTKLEAKETEISWLRNPDRMGGQFTDDEINDTI